MPKLERFAWAALGVNLAVIAWGAYVRASGSGAGCGRHWPLCNGEVVPRAPALATLIEMTHRATSGVALILVLALLVATLRSTPRGHAARRPAVLSAVFILGEALIGAMLVWFELVNHDASMKRALSGILHLGNTFFLLAAIAITALRLRGSRASIPCSLGRPAMTGLVRGLLGVALASVLVLGASGAIAALGDTLFPARSLREGLELDVSQTAHVFLRLRLLHPIFALGASFAVLAAASATRWVCPSPRARTLSRGLTLLFVAQFCAGLLNVALLAPIWMQLVHLLLADATWIALVLMAESVREWLAVARPAPSDVAPESDGALSPVTLP